MIKLVAFDLWNTLAEIKGGSTVNDIIKVFKIEDKKVFKRKFEENYQTSLWLSKFDAYKQLCLNTGIPATEENIKKMVDVSNKNLHIIEIYPHTISMLQTLKKSGLKTALVTNTSNFSINQIKETSPLLKPIDFPIFSYDIGRVKPDPKMFNALLKVSNCKPDEILYVDTERKNILVAKKLDINTILYKDFEQLKKDFVKYGILL